MHRHGISLDNRGRNPIPDTVKLLDPSLAFWAAMQSCQEDALDAVHELNTDTADLIRCPANDSTGGMSADSGTRWTLLVGWKESDDQYFRKFSFYNSSSNRDMEDDPSLQAYLPEAILTLPPTAAVPLKLMVMTVAFI